MAGSFRDLTVYQKAFSLANETLIFKNNSIQKAVGSGQKYRTYLPTANCQLNIDNPACAGVSLLF